MNLIDLLIIYLACGAPFGVYYFLNNRTLTDTRLLEFKTSLVFLFWMPFALILLTRNVKFRLPVLDFGETHLVDSPQEKDIAPVQKEMEKILLASNLEISIYEFRETVGRYAGLTLAAQIDAAKISEHEREVFRVSEKNNTELGSICLNRRNRKRLFFHQNEARRDFLYLIGQLFEFNSGEPKLEFLSIKFVRLLKDTEAENNLEKIFAHSKQTQTRLSVKKSEKDLWKPEKHRPSPTQPISPRLQTLNQTMNLRRKD
jgi:hypothetical protein